jgi:hypothetical protein
MRIDREVRSPQGETLLAESHYFVTSLDPAFITAAGLQRVARDHRPIAIGLQRHHYPGLTGQAGAPVRFQSLRIKPHPLFARSEFAFLLDLWRVMYYAGVYIGETHDPDTDLSDGR